MAYKTILRRQQVSPSCRVRLQDVGPGCLPAFFCGFPAVDQLVYHSDYYRT